MNHNFDLITIRRSSHQNTLKDGLIFISMGFVLFTVGMMMINTIFFCLMPLAILFNPTILQNLKQKYTYPRIGFVQPQKEPIQMILIVFNLGIACIFILIIVLMLFFGNTGNTIEYEIWWNLLTIGISIVLGVQSTDFGRKTGNFLYFLIAVLFVVTGFIFSLLDIVPFEHKFSIYSVLWGCALIGGGLFTFYRFLNTHPVIENEVNYNSEN